MPNTRSAQKMMRVAERRRLRNRIVKSSVKTFIRKAEHGITAGAEEIQALVVQAVRSLDKAATKGIVHPRNAARRKSRLMKKLNAGSEGSSQPIQAATKRSGRTGRSTARRGKKS